MTSPKHSGCNAPTEMINLCYQLQHFINTALTPILGYAELMQSEETTDPEKLKEYAAKILSNAKKIDIVMHCLSPVGGKPACKSHGDLVFKIHTAVHAMAKTGTTECSVSDLMQD